MSDHIREHDHSGEAEESFAESNRQHWNKFASSYTSEQWQRDLIAKVTEFIGHNIPWISNDLIETQSTTQLNITQSPQVRVLDYACGPGTVTNALLSHATEFIGIDFSENMVKAYNARFATQDGVDQLNARAVVGDLLEVTSSEALSEQEFFDFDLVAVGMGFHHFESLDIAAKRLVERLKPGGVLVIIDFITHAKEDGPATHTIAHHGFNESQVHGIFTRAGLVDIGFVRMEGEVEIKNISSRIPFLAKGRKP